MTREEATQVFKTLAGILEEAVWVDWSTELPNKWLRGRPPRAHTLSGDRNSLEELHSANNVSDLWLREEYSPQEGQ